MPPALTSSPFYTVFVFDPDANPNFLHENWTADSYFRDVCESFHLNHETVRLYVLPPYLNRDDPLEGSAGSFARYHTQKPDFHPCAEHTP